MKVLLEALLSLLDAAWCPDFAPTKAKKRPAEVEQHLATAGAGSAKAL
jgi:hypothetical protein